MDLPTPEYERWQKRIPLLKGILAWLLMAVAGALPVVVAFYLWGWYGVGVLLIVTGTGGMSLCLFKLADLILTGRK